MTFPSPTQVELINYLSVQSWMKHPEPSHPIDNKLGDSRLQGHHCGPTKTNKQTTVRSQEASDLKRYTETVKGISSRSWISLDQSESELLPSGVQCGCLENFWIFQAAMRSWPEGKLHTSFQAFFCFTVLTGGRSTVMLVKPKVAQGEIQSCELSLVWHIRKIWSS